MADKYTAPTYTEGDAVKRARKLLEEREQAKPADYASQWGGRMDDVMKQIDQRKQFTYDAANDPMYRQYLAQAQRNGRVAMADTMGQAAAMTGGYGNSYAQQVGQQTYQQELSRATDRIPELAQLAMQRYQMEGDDLRQRYAMLAEREATDYGRYRDNLGDWQTDRDYAAGRFDTERGIDMSQFNADRSFGADQFRDERDFAYGEHMDKQNQAMNLAMWYLNKYGAIPQELQEQLDVQFNVPEGFGSSGSSGGGSGAAKTSTASSTVPREAAVVAKELGTDAAREYIKNNAATKAEKNAAEQNVKGVSMTEYYKKLYGK